MDEADPSAVSDNALERGRRQLGTLGSGNHRQVMLHLCREVFMRVFAKGPADLGMRMMYDVCHNIAKKERHEVDGRVRDLCVHRKGTTRAFAPGHPDLCAAYRDVGQPVLVPGDMATGSYVLAGCDGAMAETFGSACHGAGRVLSRTAAKKAARGRELFSEMAGRGVALRCQGRTTAAEEMPEAYKDVNSVVEVVHRAGIAKKSVKIRPLAVIKGCRPVMCRPVFLFLEPRPRSGKKIRQLWAVKEKTPYLEFFS